MSLRPITRSTMSAEPTGTVDLLTTMAPVCRWVAISLAAASTYDRSAEPLALCGVGTHKKTNSAPTTASTADWENERLPAATPLATSSSSSASTMGMRPERNAASLECSRSASTT